MPPVDGTRAISPIDVLKVLRSSCANLEAVSPEIIVTSQMDIQAHISSTKQPPALRAIRDDNARQCYWRSNFSHTDIVRSSKNWIVDTVVLVA